MSLLATLRRFVVAVVILGLSAEAMAGAMPVPMDQMTGVASQGQEVDMPCGMMAAVHHAYGAAAKSQMPCNTIIPDCTKKMGCVQQAALPERIGSRTGSAAFLTVSYRASTRLPPGLTVKPELSPPLAG